MEHVEYVYTFGMDEAAIERRLGETDNAVLALADDGDAYAIPVSMDYADGELLVRLAVRADSEKMDYVESTKTATLLLYDDPAPDESWSIVVRGPIRPLTAERQASFTDTEINERFPPLRVFDEDVEDLQPTVYELDIESITGRATDTEE